MYSGSATNLLFALLHSPYNQDRDLVLRRKKEKSLDYNNSFLGEYKCSSLALDKEERRDEKKRLDNLQQDQTMYEKKMKFVEQPTGPAPDPESADPDTIDKYYETVNLEQEVACLMLSSMSPDLQRTLEKYNAYDMLKELKTMFEEQAKQELFESVKAFYACKQEEGQSVSSDLLKMKSYLEILECLGYVMSNELGVSLILNSLNKDYNQFVQNYNMHSMGKTITELHTMLKLHEKDIPKKAETPAPKNPSPPKRDNLAKDSVYKEVGHWRRKYPSYQAMLKKRKNASVASTLGIFTIELYDYSNKTWVYDMGCGTHICNTLQGLRGSKKLKHGALSLYVGNGMRAVVEAI
ncbi:hypothetical protein Tco_0337557 [Tanacetum coccineum]